LFISIDEAGTATRKMKRDFDEAIRFDVEMLERSGVDSMLVFVALNDFALSITAQSIINENPKISRRKLLEKLREIIAQNR